MTQETGSSYTFVEKYPEKKNVTDRICVQAVIKKMSDK